MYFPKLPRFLENCSPSLTTFIVFGTFKVNLDFDSSVINHRLQCHMRGMWSVSRGERDF
jgi:hypothetical protein